MTDKGVPTALSTEQLYRICDPSSLPFIDTSELDPADKYFGQDRALEALEFGVGINHEGYNLFVLGSSGMGKHQIVSDFVGRHARNGLQPGDWCYVNNFEAPHQPLFLKLAPGKASRLRADMYHCIEDILATIPSLFQSTEYKTRVNEISEEYSDKEHSAFADLRERAEQQNIALLQTPTGYTLAPLVKDQIITNKEFEELPEDEQQRLQEVIEKFKAELKKIVLDMPIWLKQSRQQVRKLNRELTQNAVTQIFTDIETSYREQPEVARYLDTVKADIIENVDAFRQQQEEEGSLPDNHHLQARAFPMYSVNVLVDNGATEGAPLIYENNPSLVNLLGRVEHEAQFGTLTTNFTLIKPGALHRANGGYLIIDAIKVLSNPFAWEALKRTLLSQEAKIESADQMLSLVSTKSLEPEPIPLNVKVILLGDRKIYYLLQAYDPDFNLLFKVPADLSEEIDRSEQNNLSYARLITSLQQQKNTRPLHAEAVARVIEQGSRRLEDSAKVPLQLSKLGDLLCEADYYADREQQKLILARHVQHAVDAHNRRLDQFRERMQESILRDIQLVDCRGSQVAQINGLSVYQIGDYAFGSPARITARARLGNGKVIDIERESKLGGNIHTKGMMILSACLANRYARERPLPISATLVFEQSYGGVEGDSASIAELTVLISAIAGIPVKQSLAVTGSINQLGQVQAIGGINQKIEGFFDICAARGLSGDQGVVMPAANVQHLMLDKRVRDAVAEGKFHIYPVEYIDQAIALLTGQPAGTADDQGNYPADSVNGQIMAKIDAWITLSKQFSAPPDKEHKTDEQP